MQHKAAALNASLSHVDDKHAAKMAKKQEAIAAVDPGGVPGASEETTGDLEAKAQAVEEAAESVEEQAERQTAVNNARMLGGINIDPADAKARLAGIKPEKTLAVDLITVAEDSTRPTLSPQALQDEPWKPRLQALLATVVESNRAQAIDSDERALESDAEDLQQLSSRMQPAPQSAAPAQSKLSRMQLAQRLASGESVEDALSTIDSL